jgi:hypothetical protein
LVCRRYTLSLDLPIGVKLITGEITPGSKPKSARLPRLALRRGEAVSTVCAEI